MKTLPFLYTTIASLLVVASNAQATVDVPEIDGSGAVIALGLTAGLVTLIRARRQSK